MAICGNCKHYYDAPLLGPTCRVTGKAVSYLSAKDECFEEKDGSEVPTKACSRCHRELPLDQFSKNRTRKDGYQRECKDCQRELSQSLYKKRKEGRKEEAAPVEPPKTKVCAKCGRELPVEMFGRNKKNKFGLKSYCKDCENENCRTYRGKKYGRLSKPNPPKVDQPVINNLLEERAIPAEELTFAAAIRELIAYGSLTIKISLTKPNAQ